MTTTKQPRATVIVEWEAEGHQGILVHADRYQNTWILPGGGLEQYQNGTRELPMAAAVRELVEETGLTVEEVKALFIHAGAHREHHVFQIWASGKLDTIKDSKEAPAFAICGPDLKPHVFLCDVGYTTDHLVVSPSTKSILTHYYQPHAATIAPPTGRRATPAAQIVADTPGNLLRVVIGDATIELTGGDIVQQDVDAVVNAANRRLADGAGVAGAIFRTAGAKELGEACRLYGGCPVGEARITPGFKLKAHHIIHAVGPRFDDYTPEQADKLLAGAYRSSLELASKNRLHSIAFPSISTGIYGFPPERAAPLALQTAIDYLRNHQDLRLVRFVLWPDNLEIYTKALKRLVGA